MIGTRIDPGRIIGAAESAHVLGYWVAILRHILTRLSWFSLLSNVEMTLLYSWMRASPWASAGSLTKSASATVSWCQSL